MPKVDIRNLSTEALIALRGDVDKALAGKRAELERQLAQLGGGEGGNGRRSLKGRKVAPKYRDSDGNTWAGRGARPRWLVAALKKGKKLENFLIK
jgi:DNA-binding protein H-NS